MRGGDERDTGGLIDRESERGMERERNGGMEGDFR